MLDRFFAPKHVSARLRAGALGSILDDVARHLHGRGHSRRVGQAYLCAAGHFSHWLKAKGISAVSVNEATLSRFRQDHLPKCRCPMPKGSRRHLRPALGHVLAVLREREDSPPAWVPPPTPLDRELEAFDRHLRDVHGAASATRRSYGRYVRGFLEAQYGAGAIELQDLRPEDLIRFVAAPQTKHTPGTAKVIRTALRSFLRFAQLASRCPNGLVGAVPRVALWKRSSVPKILSDAQVEALLSCFDLETEIGRRDHAMTLCLLQMGLRAGEVAALALEDVDWRAGTMRLAKSKEHRASVLPLPASVGRALAAYLRHGRPRTPTRQVFVRHGVPRGKPITSNAVSAVVRRAFRRAGLDVPSRGAHILRHTAATRMTRAGTSLKEVADVLRHRALETAMIYAKVDLPALREVALPWPGVRP